jgi:pimeloyl-ACP methyl ester carboxylesterase
VLVGHDWGGLLAWCFALYHPEMLDRLVIINAPHPQLFERELRENPVQRFGSEYTYAFNKYDGVVWEKQVAANNYAGLAKGILGTTLASGNYDQADVDKWIEAWKQPGALTGGLNWYRANHLNPPFNDRHPADKVPTSWSADAVLKGARTRTIATPTLVIWGLADSALQGGNLSGIEKLVTNVKVKLYPGVDHWVPMVKAKEVNQDLRDFLAAK